MNLSLFILPLVFLSLLSLPQNVGDQIRSGAVIVFQPVMKLAHSMRVPVAESGGGKQELQSLQLENFQLRKQLDIVYEWIGSEKRLRDQIDLLQKETPPMTKRAEVMRSVLQQQAVAAFGRIIYRDPSSWSSSCWIDVGEESNQSIGRKVVAKNSPVVVGSALVGVVEYVGKRQSRIRLITDSGLKAAVRAVRGTVLDREIVSEIKVLMDRLKHHPKLKSGPAMETLVQLREALPIRWEDGYFAKGEVCGSSAPYHRVLRSSLKGIGFNCDFPDEEGAALDLRSERVVQNGDLLVTSGLDGVFPAGLKVAIVKSVSALREGAFYYELEADPAAGNLNDLSSVYVLPPLSSE
jgi:cell shape-determining protein MreC